MKTKQKTNKTEEYHAKLVIKDIPTMKSVTYRRLIEWLENTVKELKKANVDDYAKFFTKRLLK